MNTREGFFTGETQFGEDQVLRELIGILVGSHANEKNQNRYMGDERDGKLKSHSFISDCAVTRSFVKSLWQAFLRKQLVRI